MQGVPRFNVEQQTEILDVALRPGRTSTSCWPTNEHLSLYLYPFSRTCQVNTWNRTDAAAGPAGDAARVRCTSPLDALLAAWVGNFLAYSRSAPAVPALCRACPFVTKRGSNLVLDSHKAFNRSIYHLHQELEFTVPFEQTFEVCDRFMALYEQLYRPASVHPDRAAVHPGRPRPDADRRRAGSTLDLDRPA